MKAHSVKLTFTYFVEDADYKKCLAEAKSRFLRELRDAGMKGKPKCIERLFRDRNELISIYGVER